MGHEDEKADICPTLLIIVIMVQAFRTVIRYGFPKNIKDRKFKSDIRSRILITVIKMGDCDSLKILGHIIIE